MSTCTCTACQTKIVAYTCSTPTGCGCRPQLAKRALGRSLQLHRCPSAGTMRVAVVCGRQPSKIWRRLLSSLHVTVRAATCHDGLMGGPSRIRPTPRHVASPCGRGLVRAPHARPPPPSRTPHHPVLPRVPSSCSPPLPPLARHAPWTAAPAPGKEKPWSNPPVLVVAMCRRPSLSDWQAIALSDVPMRPS